MTGAPSWAADAVFYQVFPDRFARSGRVPEPGPLEPWDEPPTHWGYKGGDLFGLADRLDELVELGISGLYLNPIFSAASNHRYNAYDYLHVDPLLGGDPAFRELLEAAHARGIRVILDGVFNHVGRGWWPFHHVLEAHGRSPYRDWFYLDPGVVEGHGPLQAYGHDAPRGYRGWWGTASLPKLRVEHPGVRAHLMEVAEHWLDAGIDGWRLDVPGDIEDPTFWPEWRQVVRARNPEAYLVGEIWEAAPDWVAGDRFDAVMNYPLGIAILGFAGGEHLDRPVFEGQSNYAATLVDLDGPGLAAALERLAASYPPAIAEVQYNLIGSHDTPRAVSVMGGDPARLRRAFALLLTLPGVPSIYYGDELAMPGGADPGCRGAYPPAGVELPAEAFATRSLVKELVAARRRHAALRRGTVRVVAAAGRAIVLERTAGDARALVAVNAGEEPAALPLDGPGADGLAPVELPGLPAGAVAPGGGAVDLPGGAALVLASG